MIHLDTTAIKNLPNTARLHLINSITGIKPANLIGSIDRNGNTNLAVFSSVVHLGSDPALIGFISRPPGEVARHTYENILETNYYTINHIHPQNAKQAHHTSAKFAKNESEFEHCGFTAEFLPDFKAPFVKDSDIKYGLEFVESIPIKHNNTRLVIGEIKHILLHNHPQTPDGGIDLEKTQSVGISGLNSYYKFQRFATFEQQ